MQFLLEIRVVASQMLKKAEGSFNQQKSNMFVINKDVHKWRHKGLRDVWQIVIGERWSSNNNAVVYERPQNGLESVFILSPFLFPFLFRQNWPIRRSLITGKPIEIVDLENQERFHWYRVHRRFGKA